MMVIWWWWYGDEDDDDDDDVIGDIVDDDDKDDFKGVVVAALMVYDPHQEDQGGEKGAADCIFFLELYQYILDIFISLLLKAEPLAPVGRSVYRGETLGFCQEGVQVFHHHHHGVAKSANVYLATIIRLFLTASLTVAMYQKCTAFSPHVSSPHFYKYKNNCPTTPPRLLFNIYDGLSELTCRK